jgi:hypothetical protein
MSWLPASPPGTQHPISADLRAVITLPAGLPISFAFFMAGVLGNVELARVVRKADKPNEGIRYAARRPRRIARTIEAPRLPTRGRTLFLAVNRRFVNPGI